MFRFHDRLKKFHPSQAIPSLKVINLREINMALNKMTPEACLEQMQTLPHWRFDNQSGSISREFVFRDFMQAFSFMTQIAQRSEQHNHHPNWFNVFNKVSVTWTTHDVLGLSQDDFLMAHACDDVFNNCK
jgi:4a-hydroxytetrahydrobiopterin dehydratase